MNQSVLKKSAKSLYNQKICLYFLIIGIIIRVVFFVVNLAVGGLHCDEVMSFLNAYYLADYKTDINGEVLPVYFDTWLYGGQSPLSTYILALFVKLFGKSLFVQRLPMLIMSLIGYIAFYYFIKESFGNSKYSVAIMGLMCVCPWHIFSSTFVFDCNFFPNLFIVGCLFCAKAFNTKKTVYFALSSVFFALGFYAYIASVLIIPIVVLVLYLVMLIKKQISFKHIAVAFVTMLIVSLPFILFGLVSVGIVKPFTLFGFNFGDMPYYSRSSTVAFSDSSITEFFEDCISNTVLSLGCLIFVDISARMSDVNIFQYGNLLGGIFVVAGVVFLIKMLKNKGKTFSRTAKTFSLAFAVGIVSLCMLENNIAFYYMYRYSVLSFFFVVIEGIGFIAIFSRLKKVRLKRVLPVYLACSLALFTAEYGLIYAPCTQNAKTSLYGDSFLECLDIVDDKLDGGDFVIYENEEMPLENAFCSIYSRYHYYNQKDFCLLSDELKTRGAYVLLYDLEFGDIQMTSDNSISYCNIDENTELTDDICLIDNDNLKKVTYDKSEYTVINCDHWNVVYK